MILMIKEIGIHIFAFVMTDRKLNPWNNSESKGTVWKDEEDLHTTFQ